MHRRSGYFAVGLHDQLAQPVAFFALLIFANHCEFTTLVSSCTVTLKMFSGILTTNHTYLSEGGRSRIRLQLGFLALIFARQVKRSEKTRATAIKCHSRGQT